MELSQIARTVLFGERLEDKLVTFTGFKDEKPGTPLASLPTFPGRPLELRRFGRADFPKAAVLKDPTARGHLLHFFANHELLALELMALVLLKFPEAPSSFRAGLAKTMAEEQNHMRLYLERMAELGVGFGELPVNDYFWNAMKNVESPLQFVTQMSLTLEQANLDFSRYYKEAVAAVGDEKTAALLEQVYQEEIGHVKHGVIWFNRWYDKAKYSDDWEAYLGLLPAPMSARRAKGPTYFEEPRKIAGFSERYIQELSVFAGSKGRPPVFWFFNPLCDSEIARGKPGFTPSEKVRTLQEDLETLPMFLANETDVVLVSKLPKTAWLKEMKECGFKLPEFRIKETQVIREDKIAGFEPWGWSPDTFRRFQSFSNRLVKLTGANGEWAKELLESGSYQDTPLIPLFSKSWSTAYFRNWLGENPNSKSLFGAEDDLGQVFRSWESTKAYAIEQLENGQTLLAKAPYGTSGNHNRRVLKVEELNGPLGGWVRNVLDAQGEIVLEPLLPNLANLSLQIEVGDEVRMKGIRHFFTGPQFDYRGTSLDPKLRSLEPELLAFLHSEDVLAAWEAFALTLGEHLKDLGYRGPAGLDGLIWKRHGQLRFKPLVELNPRWTLGRIAIEIEEHVAPGAVAHFLVVPERTLRAWGGHQTLKSQFPVRTVFKQNRLRLSEGIAFLNDPSQANESFALTVVGNLPSALEVYLRSTVSPPLD